MKSVKRFLALGIAVMAVAAVAAAPASANSGTGTATVIANGGTPCQVTFDWNNDPQTVDPVPNGPVTISNLQTVPPCSATLDDGGGELTFDPDPGTSGDAFLDGYIVASGPFGIECEYRGILEGTYAAPSTVEVSGVVDLFDGGFLCPGDATVDVYDVVFN